MDKIIIGSTAIKKHIPIFKRNPNDLDYAVKEKIVKSTPTVEYLYNPILFKDKFKKFITKDKYLTLNGILTLKASHIFWDIKWNKHIYDIQYLTENGAKINKELFLELYEFWNTYHKKNKRSDLKMSAKKFFNNALNCKYDHDSLHTLINPIPTYTKILKPNKEVEVCEDLFNKLSFNEKCNLVREEIYVMSWERFNKLSFYAAYNLMLKKFIISHAPIWEALFIIENYTLLSRPEYNFFKKIENNLNKIK